MDDFVKQLEQVDAKVDKLLQMVNPGEPTNKDLYKALSTAQAEYKELNYSGENAYYKTKYATLSDLMKATRSALSKNGLCAYQYIEQNEDGENFLKSVLAHTSGQTLCSTIRVNPPKNTIQQIGSYLAHMRRMTYAALTGLMVHDADDDDGFLCMKEYTKMQEAGVKPSYTSQDTKLKSFKRISKDELKMLENAMGEHLDLGEKIREDYSIDSLADLPQEKFDYIIGQIRRNVAKRDGLL